jgi:adenine-specific DNA-methyltransferase
MSDIGRLLVPTLNWLTREQDLKAAANAEYRLLVAEEQYDYGDRDTGNLIVQGDNLEALKALLPFYAGQVKCIYIDPPYNTGSAFEHYDDNMEHTIWLSMMYPRLKLLKKFLREDGAVFIQLDDNEQHYAKVICDEIFGRNNFRNTIIVSRIKKNIRERDMVKSLNYAQDFILFYAKSDACFIRPPEKEDRKEERWHALDASGLRTGMDYELFGKRPPQGRHWAWSYEKAATAIKAGILKPHEKTGKPIYKINASDTTMLDTNWTDLQTSSFNWDFPGGEKNEKVIKRILEMTTSPGDYVLDSFLGSGTTAAVAHKMGRRYIGIEMGAQAKTHCVARLKKVIDGEQGGISETALWKGGGGFRFFSLGEAIFDSERRIKPDISFENLAAHIYFTETKTPMKKPKRNSAFLGIHEGTAYALLYNGILGDKSVSGGNVLTHATLDHIMHDIDTAAKKQGAEFEYRQIVIYGEATRLIHVSLEFNNIIFKQTPYDIKVW